MFSAVCYTYILKNNTFEGPTTDLVSNRECCIIKKNSSWQVWVNSWTGLDALSRRCNALLYHQVEKVILLSGQKRPGGRTNTRSRQSLQVDMQWRMCWSHVTTWGGHECLCSLTTALSEETWGTLCLSPGRPSEKRDLLSHHHRSALLTK